MILQESSPKFQVIEGAQTLDDAIDQAANIAALRFEKGGLDASYAVLADQGKYYTAMLMDPKNKSFLITPGAGTWADGVSVYNPVKKTWKHFKNNPNDPRSLSSNNVWAIFEDRDGLIWIGTHGGGLNLYNEKSNDFSLSELLYLFLLSILYPIFKLYYNLLL